MGCASSDVIGMILTKHKSEIESAKREIDILKGQNPSSCISMIFKLMNGKTLIVPCFKSTPLFHVFLLLIDKARDTEYSNIDKLKMYYNSVNITSNFNENNNKTVSYLNFSTDTPIIYINV